jgi:DNA-binding transcriptional LysR family regulator
VHHVVGVEPADRTGAFKDAPVQVSGNQSQLVELGMGVTQVARDLVPASLVQVIALVPDFLAAREISSGTVTAFDNALIPSGRTYYLCIQETRLNETKLKKLADWLTSTAATPAN